MDFRAIIQSAGLSISEGAQALGLTRPTFYKWEQGAKPRVAIQYRAACHAAKLIEKAVACGRLPLKDPTLKTAERLAAVIRIMQEMKNN